MQLVQLLECSDTLGTCCNDYGLVAALDIGRNILTLFQIFVPIILIIWSAVEFTKMMINPDAKAKLKPLINKYLAAVIVFFIPMAVNAVLGVLPNTFEVGACWEQSKISAEVSRSQQVKYLKAGDKTSSKFLLSSGVYEKGKPTATGQGSAKGKAIVEYAKKYVGQRYVWGGTWNGEDPYTGTDCSGFVQGVFKHHGINLTRTTYTQWADTSTYKKVTDIRAGDLIMYDGHVGILTGNGKEIVHAKGSSYGIVIDPDYTKCSSHAILGIMRINGVN